jgi:hypothetical protein
VLTVAPFVPRAVPFTVGFKSGLPPASATHSTESDPASFWSLVPAEAPLLPVLPTPVPLLASVLPTPVPLLASVPLVPLLELPLPAPVPLPVAAAVPALLPLLIPEPPLAPPVEEPPLEARAPAEPHPTRRNAARTRREQRAIALEAAQPLYRS